MFSLFILSVMLCQLGMAGLWNLFEFWSKVMVWQTFCISKETGDYATNESSDENFKLQYRLSLCNGFRFCFEAGLI